MSVEATRARPAAVPAAAVGSVDCDIHCAPASMEALAPHLSKYWREYIDGAGVRLTGMPISYPAGAPTTGGGVPHGYEELKERYLDVAEPSHAIVNCLSVFEAHRHPYYVAALATAVNDWVRDELLERDPRLRASIAVSTIEPEDAIAEIERLGDDPRFVQVLLPVRADAPWGNRRFHRLFAAAAERNLVIGLHAWGRPVSAPTPNGLTFTYLEDYLSNQLIVQSHLVSLVSEGVFEQVPGLRVALLECGFAWLPPLLWRFDKDWKGLWREVPWVKEEPSAYVKRHVRATIAPALVPSDPRHLGEIVQMVGPDWLLYASDFPHLHGSSSAELLDVLAPEGLEAVCRGNAAGFYRLGAAGGEVAA